MSRLFSDQTTPHHHLSVVDFHCFRRHAKPSCGTAFCNSLTTKSPTKIYFYEASFTSFFPGLLRLCKVPATKDEYSAAHQDRSFKAVAYICIRNLPCLPHPSHNSCIEPNLLLFIPANPEPSPRNPTYPSSPRQKPIPYRNHNHANINPRTTTLPARHTFAIPRSIPTSRLSFHKSHQARP
jgi:hypothetical protein